ALYRRACVAAILYGESSPWIATYRPCDYERDPPPDTVPAALERLCYRQLGMSACQSREEAQLSVALSRRGPFSPAKGHARRMESLMGSSHTLTGERIAVQAKPT